MIVTGIIYLFVWNSFCRADIPTYKMEDHCGTEINMIIDNVYQLRLTLHDSFVYDKSLTSTTSCQTKIEPWYTWPNLMFYFERLDLDCNLGYLQFFDISSNGTKVKGLEDDICGDQKPNGLYTLEPERSLLIVYVPKQSQFVEDIVSIIITSYAFDPCPVHAFKCDNSRCIDREIRCDGYDSCGDGSGCNFDLSSVALAGIIVSSAIGLFVLITLAICIVCCVRKRRKSEGTVQNNSSHGVVYTATRNGPVTINPPTYISSQTDQPRTHCASSSNQGSFQASSSSFQSSASSVIAGQKPAYPANWTMPSYQQICFQNPPPYEETRDDRSVENNQHRLEIAATVVESSGDNVETSTTSGINDDIEPTNGVAYGVERISNADTENIGSQKNGTCSPYSAMNELKTDTAPEDDKDDDANKESQIEEAVAGKENEANEIMARIPEPGAKKFG